MGLKKFEHSAYNMKTWAVDIWNTNLFPCLSFKLLMSFLNNKEVTYKEVHTHATTKKHIKYIKIKN